MPALTYVCEIQKWSATEQEESSTRRMTLASKNGGRGLIDITNLHSQQVTKLREFFVGKARSTYFLTFMWCYAAYCYLPHLIRHFFFSCISSGVVSLSFSICICSVHWRLRRRFLLLLSDFHFQPQQFSSLYFFLRCLFHIY